MRVKNFSSSGEHWLEAAVNQWLAENEKSVVVLSMGELSITGTGSSITYATRIVYEDAEQMFSTLETPPAVPQPATDKADKVQIALEALTRIANATSEGWSRDAAKLVLKKISELGG